MGAEAVAKELGKQVEGAIQSTLFDINFVLKNELRSFFFPLVKNQDEAGQLLDLLVDGVMYHTRRLGPEDESYPGLDRDLQKKVDEVKRTLFTLLQKGQLEENSWPHEW